MRHLIGWAVVTTLAWLLLMPYVPMPPGGALAYISWWLAIGIIVAFPYVSILVAVRSWRALNRLSR